HDVPLVAWRRAGEGDPGAAGPADVTLTRPSDDDLVRTVTLIAGLPPVEHSRLPLPAPATAPVLGPVAVRDPDLR
ncbi:MAG TPA: hypothetical protein VHE35_01930, partial [Kofleriaceae bacterium]|nr:hypothetical protein [Kofleriaceae bacterium]